MLELAGAGPNDVLYDLGCGDGRIPIIAVKEFGVKRAVCVELRHDLIVEARRRAREAGVDSRIEFREEDMFETSISDATVVTLYLLTSVNDALAPKLERELADGVRIVSHEFQITQWRPIMLATIYDDGLSHNLYLYVKGYHKP
jgi:ubiquinone/menaquinone biosynthesis C-methylase UbiE